MKLGYLFVLFDQFLSLYISFESILSLLVRQGNSLKKIEKMK